jgi:tetratricopeptide (TPR) repeat protein
MACSKMKQGCAAFIACATASLFASLTLPATYAQVRFDASERANLVDPYGNVQPVGRSFMRDIYYNNVQYGIYAGYHTGRPFMLRQAVPGFTRVNPYAGPNFLDQLAARDFLPLTRRTSEMPSEVYAPLEASAAYYALFGPYRGTTTEQSTDEILRRKSSMLSVLGVAGPLRVAQERSKDRPTPRGIIERTPVTRSQPMPEDEPSVSLGQQMTSRFQVMHRRAMEEAWSLFEERKYRQAARSFQAALSLKPRDVESRIGEIFSALETASFKSAMATLQQLMRHTSNPFAHQVDMPRRYGSARAVQAMRTRMQRFVQEAEGTSDPLALYALAMWYLGMKEQAKGAAEKLKQLGPDSAYYQWGKLMEDAEAAAVTAEKEPSEIPQGSQRPVASAGP